MAIVLKDRVKETTAVTGTGTATLLGAVTGYQAFSVIGNGNTTYYAIVDVENGTWEVGTGTYSTTGPTLARTTVFESSNGGALVDFAAGAKDVFITYPAERAIYEEPDGQTLIDGGPITILGNGVTLNPSLEAELGKFVGNVDSFGQVYNLNQNDGSNASADFVAYNDLTTDGFNYFTDMGISSSTYTSVDYPLFTPNSGYVFHGGDDFFLGNQTTGKDVVLFAGGVDTVNEAVRIKGADQSVELASDLTVDGDVNAVGGTFTAAVTTTASMVTPATTEFVTREYVDNATSNGFHVHTPVLVATTGNLTATYNQPGGAGDGVGATLTNSGTQVALEIDGVPMTVADRILVWQQTTGLQNGIYVVTTVGDGSTNWVLTRSADANTSSEGDPGTLGGGDYFFVESGDTLGYHSYVCVNTTAITFGTTSIDFNEFSSVPQYNVTAPLSLDGNTLALTGTVAATNGGTGTATVTTGDLLYGSGTNTWGKLAAGAGYKSLVMNAGGTNVEWNAIALNQSGAVSGALPATNGGTGQNAYAVGDILYSGVTNTLSKLAGNTTTTKNFLVQTGTGSASAAPTWGTISGSDVNGTVSSATNVAGGAINQIVYQTGTGATGFVTAPVSSNTALVWNGSSLGWGSAGASITDDTTTNASYYPVWANGTSGSLTTAYVSSTKLSFNPSTGVLSATGFSGAWSGTTIPTTKGGTGLTSFTANGVVYASSTSALTTGTALQFDGTNLGVGVTPSAWNTAYKTFQAGNASLYGASGGGYFSLGSNFYTDSGGTPRYISTVYARQLLADSEGFKWNLAASGTAGNAISFTQAMTLDASGNLGLGSASPTASAARFIQIAGAATSELRLQNTTTGATNSDGFAVQMWNDGNVYLWNYENSATVFSTNATERMRITATGGVSFGATGTAYGSSGQVLTSNGNAAPTWNTPTAAAIGSTTQVAYNSAGTMTGSANLTFNGTNLTCGGNVVANSDESLKTNWRDLPADFVEQLAKVKHGTYDRVDVELTQDGVSAQSLQNLLPNSVLKGEDGKLSVAYGNAALVAAIALAERVVQLEAIVAKLTKGTEQ